MARTNSGTPLFVEDSIHLCSPFTRSSRRSRQRRRRSGDTIRRSAPISAGKSLRRRGVAYWVADRLPQARPAGRALRWAPDDVRVIALDATTGIHCADLGPMARSNSRFGPVVSGGEFQITSAPVVSRGVSHCRSSISDNRRVEATPGNGARLRCADRAVRAGMGSAVHGGIIAGHCQRRGADVMDEDRGCILPTSSPSPDFGGKRPGNNEHANSWSPAHGRRRNGLVFPDRHTMSDYDSGRRSRRLRVSTRRWSCATSSFQPTKQGFGFVLDRDTAKPVGRVEEASVPQGGDEGEETLADPGPAVHSGDGADAATVFKRRRLQSDFQHSAARLEMRQLEARATRALHAALDERT